MESRNLTMDYQDLEKIVASNLASAIPAKSPNEALNNYHAVLRAMKEKEEADERVFEAQEIVRKRRDAENVPMYPFGGNQSEDDDDDTYSGY